MNATTFQEYVIYRDNLELMHEELELKRSFGQGFAQQYDKQLNNRNIDSLESATIEKYKSLIEPKLKKVSENAKYYSDKLGLPISMVTTALLAGITGGWGAIPVAVLTHYATKPVYKAASKGYDMAANYITSGQEKNTQQVAWTTYEENVLSKIANWGAEKAGRATGFMAGKSTRYFNNVVEVLKKSGMKLRQFASENKVAVGKILFLTAVGALIGYGVGKIYDQASMAVQGINQFDRDTDLSFVNNVLNQAEKARLPGTAAYAADQITTSNINTVLDNLPKAGQ